MKNRRIYIAQNLQAGERFELPKNAAHHLSTVLRVRPGEMLSLFNGRGGEYQAEIVALEKRAVTVEVLEHDLIERESPLKITLLQSLSRGQKMDLTIQKAVELGVQRIVPLATERSNVKLSDERQEKRVQHWQGIIISACEQCGRNQIPELMPVLSLQDYLKDDELIAKGVKWVLQPGGVTTLKEITTPPSLLQLLVGCEGGFTADELQQLQAAGFTNVCLGPRVVRTETAALMAVAAIQALWGDF